MSDSKENGDSKSAAPEPDVIDVEIVKEEVVPDPQPVSQAEKKPSSKLGWISSGLLAAFLGGIYAAPYFQEGLVTLGLVPAKSAVVETAQDLTPLRKTIEDLTAQLNRHQEILGQHDERLTAGASDISTLRENVSNIDTSPTFGATDVPAETAALKETIDRLTNDVARLAALSDGADPAIAQLTGAIALLKAEAEQMHARFAALETALEDVQSGAIDASPRGRLLLSLGRIKERALRGFNFTGDIEALRPDMAALSALDQQLIGAELAVLQEASGGIVTYEQLVQEFDGMAATALQSAQKEEGSFLSNLFTVRRTDAAATGNDAIFLAAERRLVTRDVPGAVTELQKLTGAALAATETWRTNAATLARVESAFDRTIMTVTAATNANANSGDQS